MLVVLLTVALAGCGGRSGSQTDGSRTPVVVDTDMSSDDLIAIAALARDDRIRLEAVTVSGTGLVHCPDGARLASELLSALGRGDVPVACGSGVPMQVSHALPEEWRAAADGMFGLELPAGRLAPRGNAVSLLRRAIDDSERPATIVELAPMTDVAELLQRSPDTAHRIGLLVAMGGAVAVPGNAPGDAPGDAAAETNVWLDPKAASVVLRSGVPTTLVPLDATNGVPVTTSVSEVLKRYHFEAPAATIVWDLILATGMDRGGQYFWDPLAALAASRPSLLHTATRQVAVTTTGRTILSSTGSRIRVALGADRAAFERTLLRTLLDGHPYVPARRHADAAITYSGTGCSYRGVRSIVAGTITVDTRNTSSRPFTWIAGRLDPSRPFASLARWALDPRHGGTLPPWFALDASGDTPPHSGMTWQATLPTGTSGTTIVACGTASPPQAWLLARIAVFTSR